MFRLMSTQWNGGKAGRIPLTKLRRQQLQKQPLSLLALGLERMLAMVEPTLSLSMNSMAFTSSK